MAIADNTFIPRRGLRGGHVQTLAGNFLPRENLLPPGEERLFQVEEEAQVLCVCHWQNQNQLQAQSRRGAEEAGGNQNQNQLQTPRRKDAEGSKGEATATSTATATTPDPTFASRTWGTRSGNDKGGAPMTVIIVHGLEGSIDSRYVIGVGSKAWALGMNVVRMNMRNCGGTEALTPTLYHSGLSADVGAVVERLVREDGLQRIALVGYSMGGNLVLKLAGDWAENAPPELKAVCGVSPAMDLAPSADALHDPANRIYEWKFLHGLKRRFERKAKLFPSHYDASHSRWFRSIREFDHEITARYSGFASADDYYARASSANVVDKIRVPTLILHAQDDPFIRVLPETRAKLAANPAVKYIETRHGGHCAFLGADQNLEPQRTPRTQREDRDKATATPTPTPTPGPTLAARTWGPQEEWGTQNGYDGRWAEKTCIDFIAERS